MQTYTAKSARDGTGAWIVLHGDNKTSKIVARFELTPEQPNPKQVAEERVAKFTADDAAEKAASDAKWVRHAELRESIEFSITSMVGRQQKCIAEFSEKITEYGPTWAMESSGSEVIYAEKCRDTALSVKGFWERLLEVQAKIRPAADRNTCEEAIVAGASAEDVFRKEMAQYVRNTQRHLLHDSYAFGDWSSTNVIANLSSMASAKSKQQMALWVEELSVAKSYNELNATLEERSYMDERAKKWL